MTYEPPLDCWFLTGPTASGKTSVSLALAERLGAEIVSLDSMALYRGMDIGTAKPSVDERCAIPHHLIDILNPSEEFSLAQYVEAAHAAIAAIRRRKREVLFVGGTPLYLKGMLRGIFEGPAADWNLRRQLEAEAARQEPGYLHRRLAEVDPEAANRLHANDTRRLIRAIEVHEKTGRPISDWQRQFDVAHPADQCRVFVLDWPREELYRRIDRRVESMFDAGLVDEVRHLMEDGPGLGPTASQGVGYREVLAHLRGETDLAETLRLVQMHTRQFAKRQGTWFRSLSECRFVTMGEGTSADTLAERMVELG